MECLSYEMYIQSVIQLCPRTPADAYGSSEQSVQLASDENRSRSYAVFWKLADTTTSVVIISAIQHPNSCLIAGHFSARVCIFLADFC